MVRIFSIAAGIAISLFLLSNKGGRNQECTGAPHENNTFACAECHSGGNYTPTVQVVLKDINNQEVTQYTSGNEYTVEMRINTSSGKPSYYGFQAVALNTQQKQAGEYISLGDKVRKLTLSERVYLMQISPRPDGIFTAKWKAGNNDTTTIYIAGLAANGNNGTGGDKCKTGAFSFTKNQASANHEVLDNTRLLQSNIVTDRLLLNEDLDQYHVLDVHGRRLAADKNDLTSVPPGIYFLQYTIKGRTRTERFYKL